MRLILTMLIAGAFSLASAYHPDYFPLQPGNQWVYQRLGQPEIDPLVVSVEGFEFFENKAWSRVKGLGSGDLLLRLEEDGRLVAYDEETGTERQLLAFGAAEGEPFETELDPCNDTGTVTSRTAEVVTPIGEFNYALNIAYTPTCADAGITTDFYLPYIGLIRREETTIAGPRTWELVYARLGGVTYVTEPSVSFTVALSRYRLLYPGVRPDNKNMTLRVRMTLRNNRMEPFELMYASGQRFDIEVRRGEETIYVWSADKLFAQVAATETFGNGERNYVVDIPLEPKPGDYTVEAWLTTQPRRFSATAGFTIDPVVPHIDLQPPGTPEP